MALLEMGSPAHCLPFAIWAGGCSWTSAVNSHPGGAGTEQLIRLVASGTAIFGHFHPCQTLGACQLSSCIGRGKFGSGKVHLSCKRGISVPGELCLAVYSLKQHPRRDFHCSCLKRWKRILKGSDQDGKPEARCMHLPCPRRWLPGTMCTRHRSRRLYRLRHKRYF